MGGQPPRLNAQLVATGSLAIDCLLVVAKLTTGLLTGSLALLSEAAHSGLDLVASAFALFAVRASHKSADPEHPYGHGRAENLAAFGEGVETELEERIRRALPELSDVVARAAP